MTDKDTVKDLINQATNTRHLVDEINKAHLGFTTDELIRMALGRREEHGDDEDTPGKQS